MRKWAKATIDDIEAELAEQEAVIGPYNNRAVERATALVAERRAVLQSAEDLRGGLGKGI